MAAPPAQGNGPRRPPLPHSIWDYDAMVAEHGFSDAQLQRLWLALLRDSFFLASALGDGADADDATTTTPTTTTPSTTTTTTTTQPVPFTSPACQRALDAMKPPLPKRLRALLERGDAVAAMTARAALVRVSGRGDAVKLLVRLADGLEVETVVMVYGLRTTTTKKEDQQTGGGEGAESGSAAADADAADADSTAADSPAAAPPQPGRRRSASGARTAVCFSSQYGCRLGCVFCATGRMGVGANLSAGEIVEQSVLARAACAHFGLPAPASALAMGQGEPVCGGNYGAVVSAVRSLTHPARGFGLARRRVTLSTVGAVPPRIVDLARDLPGVSLALSLHAPDQALRERIVPSAKGAPLSKILAAVDAYTRHSGQRVFVEYVLLAGVNDGAEHARALRELLSGRDVVVNAIPWNPVLAAEGVEQGIGGESPVERFEAPTAAAVAAFHAEVWRGGKGVPCTVRQERGQDIEGACGQLATAVAAERRRKQRGTQQQQQQQQQLSPGDGGGGCGDGCGGGGGSKKEGGGGGDVEDAGARAGSGRDQGGGGGGEAGAAAAPAARPLWRRLMERVAGAS